MATAEKQSASFESGFFTRSLAEQDAASAARFRPPGRLTVHG